MSAPAFVFKPSYNLQSLTRHGASIVSLILVIICAQSLAQLTWMLLPVADELASAQPVTSSVVTQKGSNRNAIGQLSAAHLFGSAETVAGDNQQVAVETRLSLVLRGVFAAESPQYAIAIIASGKSNDEEVYGIGDSLPGNALLREVHPEHVILERGGQREILKLVQDEGNGLTIDTHASASLDLTTANSPGEALSQIRKTILRNPTSFGEFALPVVVKEQGKQVGYRLQPQANGKELLSQIGLEASDIITEINGVKLDNPQNGISALRKLSSAQAISIMVRRNGVEVPLNIQLQ